MTETKAHLFSQWFEFDTLKLQLLKRLSRASESCLLNSYVRNSSRWSIIPHLGKAPPPEAVSFRCREDCEKNSKMETKQTASTLTRPRFGGVMSCLYDDQTLEPYRLVGDPELDNILNLCTKDGLPGAGRFDDIVALAAAAHAKHKQTMNTMHSASTEEKSIEIPPSQKELADFYEHYMHPPDWVDWEQLQRGIDVFIRYMPAAGLSLFYRSLAAGFSIPEIVAVLIQTQYLAPPAPAKKVQERLLDTGGFLASVMHEPFRHKVDAQSEVPTDFTAASLRPGATGWAAALRVRHLHAKVRRSILSATTSRETKKKWDTAKLGVPINQEDMAATLLAFSINVIEGIEFVAGREMNQKDQVDYLALWRYLGWLLGVDTIENVSISGGEANMKTSNPARFCTDGDKKSLVGLPPLDPCRSHTDSRLWPHTPQEVIVHAWASLDSILCHLLHPDESSKALVSHMLRVGHPKEEDQTHSFSYRFRSIMFRRFLGCQLGDRLSLPKRRDCPLMVILSFILLFMMRFYTLAVMKIPMARNRISRLHSNRMNRFFMLWSESHYKRMNSCKGMSQQKAPDASSGAVKNECDVSSTSSTNCPFSMVMPPKTANGI